MKIVICVTTLILAVLLNQPANAFEVNVHEKISTKAVDEDKANLNTVLKAIGLTNGLGEEVNGKIVRRWIEDGSKQEDNTIGNPPFRYLNHFYNPITNSGLADFPFYGSSSYDWANSNDWSWQVARSNYLLGLTSSTDNARKTALSNTFRALGQVTHLVQDLASPAHVRNYWHLQEFGA